MTTLTLKNVELNLLAVPNAPKLQQVSISPNSLNAATKPVSSTTIVQISSSNAYDFDFTSPSNVLLNLQNPKNIDFDRIKVSHLYQFLAKDTTLLNFDQIHESMKTLILANISGVKTLNLSNFPVANIIKTSPK